jgi:hypothetical protein
MAFVTTHAAILRGGKVEDAGKAKRASDLTKGGLIGTLESMEKDAANVLALKDDALEQSSLRINWLHLAVVQLIFGIVYYFLVVQKFPKIEGLTITKEAVELQQADPVIGCFQSSFPNCLLSWCCFGPRAAHTLDKAKILDYPAGCCLLTFFPCCTLALANLCTDFKVRLGGTKPSVLWGCFMACCCPCCSVAQDAQSLDLITRENTYFCGTASMDDA